MAFDAQKTLMLEKQYLYVRASKGFYLEGTSTERIWTNTGYYRFLVRNVADAIGNSYVTVHYDSSDTDFIAYCSDLFLEELQNSVTVAVENIESAVDDFASQNHEDIEGIATDVSSLNTGLSGAIQLILAKMGKGFDPLSSPIHLISGGYGGTVYCDSAIGDNDERFVSYCFSAGRTGVLSARSTDTNGYIVTNGVEWAYLKYSNGYSGGFEITSGDIIYIKKVSS